MLEHAAVDGPRAGVDRPGGVGGVVAVVEVVGNDRAARDGAGEGPVRGERREGDRRQGGFNRDRQNGGFNRDRQNGNFNRGPRPAGQANAAKEGGAQ